MTLSASACVQKILLNSVHYLSEPFSWEDQRQTEITLELEETPRTLSVKADCGVRIVRDHRHVVRVRPIDQLGVELSRSYVTYSYEPHSQKLALNAVDKILDMFFHQLAALVRVAILQGLMNIS